MCRGHRDMSKCHDEVSRASRDWSPYHSLVMALTACSSNKSLFDHSIQLFHINKAYCTALQRIKHILG